MRWEFVQLALAAAAASSGLGEDLGGTAALGGGLAETFQQLLPRTFFFPLFPGGGDGGGGGRGREGSFSSLSQCSPAAFQEERRCPDEPPQCVPDCPQAGSGRGAQRRRWVAARLSSFLPAVPPARRRRLPPALCAKLLRVLASGLPAAGASPRALPGARARVAGRLTALGFVLLGRLGEPGRGRGRGRGRGTWMTNPASAQLHRP